LPFTASRDDQPKANLRPSIRVSAYHPGWPTTMLSIKRVLPTKTAMDSNALSTAPVSSSNVSQSATDTY
jgi:hypothetical protein